MIFEHIYKMTLIERLTHCCMEIMNEITLYLLHEDQYADIDYD